MKPFSRFSFLACALAVLWLPGAVLSVRAAEPPSSADWALSPDGAHVLDLRAGLAWPRCVEGMQWSGKSCTGKPLLLDRAEATALATDRWKAEGVGWRLPRAAELQRLVDKSLRPPGLHPLLFPAAPGQWHWSSTANVSAPGTNPYSYGNIVQGRSGDGARQASMLNGWAVNLSTGEARGDAARASKLPVRLVRPHGAGGVAK